MAHFYLDETLGDVSAGDTVSLTGAEARHAAGVSRLRVGETVLLGNGNGLILTVEAKSVDKEKVTFVVVRADMTGAPTTRVTLVQALTKGDRDERAIEAATELGIDHVIPWAASRCVSVWNDAKVKRGVERWRTIVREAAKQSIRAFVPTVGNYLNTEDLCRDLAGTGAVAIVLDPTGDVTNSYAWNELVAVARANEQSVVIIVGPEGGITPGELERFDAVGVVRVSLGAHILRSSTAGPAFLAAINGALGRW